jgi:hypothetical protein
MSFYLLLSVLFEHPANTGGLGAVLPDKRVAKVTTFGV